MNVNDTLSLSFGIRAIAVYFVGPYDESAQTRDRLALDFSEQLASV